MKLLIDTDTAGDDVTSLLFGLTWPEVELVGITVVAGNVFLEQAVANALYTAEVAERTDVPVFAGAESPLLRPLLTAHHVHGDDGMGNCNFPPARKAVETTHAVDAMIDLIDESPGELEIVAQAPLTNVALALMKDPELPRKVKRLWIMGGANNSLGNITPAAEFNFYVDPEAAHMVMRAGFEISLVPWDVCVNDGYLLREDLELIGRLGTTLSAFYLDVNGAVWDYCRTQLGVDGISHPDALTIAMAIDRRVILDSARYFVDVEHRGELTRGYSVVDVRGALGEEPTTDVVTRADKARFKQMLQEVLG